MSKQKVDPCGFKKGESRLLMFSNTNEMKLVRLMAWADGYCMVRRPGCAPFVVTYQDWQEGVKPPKESK